MNCPAREKLELHFESALSPEEAATIATHALTCEPCGAHLRRLEEEAQALKRNLPDVAAPARLARLMPPASNPWKVLSFLTTAAALVLALGMVWMARRTADALDATRANVQAQVRFHLDQKEPEKAIAALAAFPGDAVSRLAADALRVDIAAICEDGVAARLLDEVDLAGKELATAERVAEARLAAYERLFEKNVLQNGVVPTPFELAPYRWEKQALAPREEMSRIVAQLLMVNGVRRDLASRRGAKAPESEFVGLARIAQYALGEVPFDALHASTDLERLALGDVLYRERQFDRAIEAWKRVIANERVYRKIAELAALRRLAPKSLNLWNYDVESLLGRDPKIEAEATAKIDALFKRARPGVLQRDEVREKPEITEDPVFEQRWREIEIANDPDQLYLLIDHQQFRLELPSDRPFTARNGASFTLKSAYRGPIRSRLYRVADLETFATLSEVNLVERRGKLALAQEWETTFEPLWKNGGMGSFRLEAPKGEAGLFVLVVEARYCPVYAVAKFIVTDAALIQQVAEDRVLLFAADRVTGVPVAGLALAGVVTGEYALRPEDSMPVDDSNADEFKRGFEAAWGGKAAEPDAGPGWTRGFQRARTLRASHPDVQASFQGTTNGDGLFEWTVAAPWQANYRYRVKTSTTGGTYSRVESEYAVDGMARWPRTLVYSDRPVYRPGDLVQFKAMLRVLDNEGLQPWDGREALFTFGQGSRPLFAKSWPISDLGTANGSFQLPFDSESGSYWVRVNNVQSHHVFTVEEYRKPEFMVVLNHPATITAGQPVIVDVAVRTYAGDAIANAPVDLYVSMAPVLGKSASVADGWYGTSSPGAVWREIEARTLTTDASGLCTVRFQTDAGIPAQYSILARARDKATRREVEERSRVEAHGPRATNVTVEADRPSYFPGERAILRIRAEGASAVRVEERTADEKRFMATSAVERGLATVEYIVPERESSLHVGVRAGDEWAWTPVPVKISARQPEGALSVRPDRAIYRLGEKANIVIRSSEREQHVLVELGTGRILQRQVVPLENGEAVVVIPVTQALVPNVTVVAVAVRGDTLLRATGDLRVPPNDRFLTVEIETDKPEYRPGEECKATIRVVDAQGRAVGDCEVSLGVVDEAIYAVEEDRTPDLREYFHRYERKLAFTESFFFRESPGAFILWKAPTFVRGMRSVYDIIGGGGGGGGRFGSRLGGRTNLVARGGGSGATAGWLRSDFRDTAFWEAALRTNADGVATVSFPFPESLTGFRFTARGITRDAKVGTVKQHAVVRKPFYTRLATPRILQEGNTLAIAAIVHNLTPEAQTVHVAFKGSYPVTASTATPSIVVAAGAFEKIEYLVSVDRWLHDATFTFAAWSDSGLKDGVEITVPGHRHGAPFQEGHAGTVAAGTPTEEVFRVPDGVIPGTLALRFNLDAGVHAAVIEGLEPLIEYPYGCIEQTMSRFFPAAVASRAIGQAPNRWSETLPSVVASGLRRVYSHQQGEGSWGWFGRDGSSDGMTAYVVYGLSICKKSGVGVDRSAVERGATWLRTRLDQIKERQSLGRSPLPGDLDRRIYMLLALSEFETAWSAPTIASKRLAGMLASRDDERSAADEVMLAIACRRLGLAEEAERLAKRAEKRPLADIATAAFVLQLQAERGGDVAESLKFLLSRREGKGWRTTIESAYAILGLSTLLQRAKPGDYVTPGKMTVQVNGVAVRELTLPSGLDAAFDGRISVPEPAEGWHGKIVVRLSFDGKGTAFYTASLVGMLGGEDRPAVKRGLEIVREYYEEQGDGWRRVADGQVRAGRPVLVRLKITSPEEREFVMVTDPRGDGFEPRQATPRLQERRRAVSSLSDVVELSEGWQARMDEFRRTVRGDAARESAWAKSLLREILEKRRFKAEGGEEELALPEAAQATVEHRDDRTIFFLARLGRGETNLYYVVRPECAGTIHVLASTASPMYEPEIFAAGMEDRMTVADDRVVAAKAHTLSLASGVAGLAEVIGALGEVDADTMIALLAGNPSIGALLMSVADERSLRTWLAQDGVATRMLAARALGSAQAEWLGVIEEAMRAPAKVAVSEINDGALQWIREDRAFRLSLLESVQRMKGTARVDGGLPEGVTIEKILAAAGRLAPTGDALVQWKLSQRVEGGALTMTEIVELCERDLKMSVKQLSAGDVATKPAAGRTMAELLDDALGGTRRYWKVREGAIMIGTLEELTK